MGRISDIPISNRPRERALRFGVKLLSDNELIALIIGSGIKGKSVLEISNDIFNSYKNLSNLSKDNLKGLMNNEGIDEIKAITLLAVFEIHERLLKNEYALPDLVNTPSEVLNRYKYLNDTNKENLIILMLNYHRKIIKEVNLTSGKRNKIDISFTDILKELLIADAKCFILIHNHPSETYFPSQEDIFTTIKLREESKHFDITLLDHIIITNEGYFSFVESGKIKL